MRLSIQSKLLVMLIGVSLASIAITGWLAYSNGRDALTQRATTQLEAQRNARGQRLQSYFVDLKTQILEFADNPLARDAIKEFGRAFTALDATPPTPAEIATLEAFYKNDFAATIAPLSDGVPVTENLLPPSNAGRVLQSRYVVGSRKQDGASASTAANQEVVDATDYGQVHARLHPAIKNTARRFQYHDLMLFDTKGTCVYSVEKEIDYANNALQGPIAATNMGRAYRAALESNQRDFAKMVDFERYVPSFGEASAFIAAPVFDGTVLIGVVVVQIPTEPIEAAVSGGKNWREEGLGESGEVYLVGQDSTMRSNTRFLSEQPEQYYATLAGSGMPDRQLARIKKFHTSILEQEIHSELARRALRAETGSVQAMDYRGIPVIGAYGPMRVGDLTWGIVAKMDTAEALRPVANLKRTVLIAAVVLQLFITMLSLGLARVFVRPIQRLMKGSKAVGEGKLDTIVDAGTGDEFRDLAAAFNAMTGKLKAQTTRADQSIKQSEELLHNILPGSIAKRLKDGEPQIADAVPNVTVMLASLVEFDAVTAHLPAEQIGTLLNELIGAFDDAAERVGVEKVKTVGTAYLAVSGLNIPAMDHPQRTVELAKEMIKAVERFNQRHHLGLRLRVGINTGAVMAGVVGRSKFIYDLWGDTVNIAQALEHAGVSGTSATPDAVSVVLATATTYERVKDAYQFERSPDAILIGKGAQNVYRLTEMA
jgi:class 3 adenylate cyclase